MTCHPAKFDGRPHLHSEDFKVPVEQVITVCLSKGKTYNEDNTLWAAIMDQTDNKLKARLHRYLDTKRYAEERIALRKQLVKAGRFLWELPGKH